MDDTARIIEPLDPRPPKELTDTELMARVSRAQSIHCQHQRELGHKRDKGMVMFAPDVWRELARRNLREQALELSSFGALV